MKSLRLFVCILITTLSLFVAFSSPEKSFAAVSESDYNLLRSYSSGINQDYRTIIEPALLPSNWRDLVKDIDSDITVEYLDILDKNYNSLKNDPTATKDILKQKTLTDFVSYLNGEVANSSGFRKSALEAVQQQAVYNLKIAISAVQLASGTITAEQNRANQATANAELNKSLQARQDAQNSGKCGFFDPGACVSDALTWLIKTFLLEMATFILWAAANIFNYSIVIGVLEFSKWAPDTLYPIWLVVRQILSLIIVFVGLYLGFLYIIGDEKERFKRYMPWVIVFALFVNFSYPLARTVIDVSNIVTLKVYTSAIGDGTLTNNTSGIGTAGGIIVSRLGLQGLLASSKDLPTGSTVDLVKKISSVPSSLMLVAFVLYAAYILFMVTLLIVIRTASLVFMIVVSPLLFVDSVIPMLGEKAKELRKLFLDQLIVGPVFMIMLALTLKFLEVFSDKSKGGVLTVQAFDTTISDFFGLLLMLIMLHIMLKVTKSVSGQLGTIGTDVIGKVGGLGLGVATGGMAFAGRQAIGRAATAMKDRGWVSKNPDAFSHRMANSLSNSSFDLRNSKVVAKGASMAGLGGGMFGVGMGGTSKKTGFEEDSNKKMELRAATASRIKTKHERTVFNKDGTVKYEKGDVDEKGVKARNEYLSSGSFFMTKEQNQKLKDKVLDEEKSTKNEAQIKAIQQYKDFGETSEDLKAKQEFFNKQDKETQAKLLKYDHTIAGEENRKVTKETEDKTYKEETLKTQRDLVQAQKENANAQKKLVEVLTGGTNQATSQKVSTVDINLSAPAANNPSYTEATPEKSVVVDQNGKPFNLETQSNIPPKASQTLTPTTNNPSYAPGVTTPAPAKSLIVDQDGNHFDLDAQGNPIPKNGQVALLAGALDGDRAAARAARERRTKAGASGQPAKADKPENTPIAA